MGAEQNRSPESAVREIKRKTRRKFTPSEKIRIVHEEAIDWEIKEVPHDIDFRDYGDRKHGDHAH